MDVLCSFEAVELLRDGPEAPAAALGQGLRRLLAP
jgi:hypothetical protein